MIRNRSITWHINENLKETTKVLLYYGTILTQGVKSDKMIRSHKQTESVMNEKRKMATSALYGH